MPDDVAPAAAPEATESTENKSLSSIIDSALEATEQQQADRERQPATEEPKVDPVESLKETPEEAEAKAAEPGRDEQGRFKAKEDTEETAEEKPETKEEPDEEITTFVDAPKRFSPEAKEAWKKAPEPVRAEITRAVEEMETGLEQYKQEFEPFKDFAQQLKERGQTFEEVFDRYDGIEKQLAENPLRGLDTICRNMGSSLQQVAQQVLQQPAEQGALAQDNLINDLRGEIDTLKREISGVTGSIAEQTNRQMQAEINAFAAEHPRFEELRADMGFFMESDRAKDMQEAYELAERLNPAPKAPEPAAPAAPTADETAQTRKKGQLSVTGAPSSGSNPSNRKPPSSAGEAVDRAFDQLGI